MRRLAGRLEDELEELVRETDREATARHPALAGVDPGLRRAVIDATFRRVVGRYRGEAGVLPDAAAAGRAAARAGLDAETVNAGYRVGARVGWAATRRIAAELALPPADVLALADAHVRYVDDLARETAEAFASVLPSARQEQARARDELVAGLLGVPGLTAPEAARAARAAGWTVPPLLAVAVWLEDPPPAGDATLIGAVGATLVGIGPPEALRRPAVACAIGPAVDDAARLGESLTGARRLAALAATGALPADAVLDWDAQLVTLAVHADPAVAAALADRLEPLRSASAAHAELLRETLEAWLAHPGRPSLIAARLHLHPQTVRYRLERLRDAFGAALDDPTARLELALALRADLSR